MMVDLDLNKWIREIEEVIEDAIEADKVFYEPEIKLWQSRLDFLRERKGKEVK